MKKITAFCLSIIMIISQFSFAGAAPGNPSAASSGGQGSVQQADYAHSPQEEAPQEEESADPNQVLPEELPAEVILDKSEGLQTLRISGAPAVSQQQAAAALSSDAGLSSGEALAAAKELFAVRKQSGVRRASGLPRQADGSSIEGISAKWITEDTIENNNPALLYVKPNGDETQSLRLQISYALSGEHNYEPGDVTITVPAHIFKDREGRDAGRLLIPFLEEPSEKGDFNWKLVGDHYILTNTRKMSAATKGYIQFAVMDLTPHTIPDSRISDEFTATIEVMTHLGNMIGLTSNALTALIDTEARVTDTVKRASEAKRVPASEIPASQRIPGETEYIVVDWTVWGYTEANTVYDLKVEDTIPNQYRGFIVNSDSGNSRKKTVNVNDTYRSGITSTWTFRSAYPASQFQPDTEYVFNNTAVITVTEEDPAVGSDPKLVTSKSANARRSYSYHAPRWIEPQGHYNVFKNGNDDYMGQYKTHKNGITYSSDRHLYDNGYYGIYPKALNQLRRGEEVELAYTVDTIGYIFPWTYKYNPADGVLSARKIANYGQYHITMTTTDTGMRIHGLGNLNVFTDYEFKAVEFPYLPYIWSAEPQNINPDGSWVALHAGDGTFNYKPDYNNSHIPDVKLEIRRNGVWEEYATVSYTSGQPVITKKNGESVSGIRLNLPEGVETFRTSVTTNIAAVQYDVRPIVTLKSTDRLKAAIESAFDRYYTPEMAVYNGTSMVAVSSKDPSAQIVKIDKEGYDMIRGFTSDIMVVPEKRASQDVEKDVDYENRQVTVHYSASVTERSFIADAVSYREAMEEGVIPAETHGVWRDLLPRGATPVLESVKLREGDAIRRIYTIENYQNTGRTLLVVEADLTPVPTRYASGDTYYYQDQITISFDALYDFDNVIDYGDNIHNVISFESGGDSLGTVPGYSGEPDDPNAGRHVATPGAFADETEKTAMTDLNPDHNNPSFVYAGVTTKLDLVSAARTSLNKEVQTNFDGRWSDGIWRGNQAANARVVYTGGIYQYRLRMMSDADTVSKNLHIFDVLEEFYAGDGNDAIDIGAPRWQGSLIGVDLSQLELAGCAPVLYYSTVQGLELAEHDHPDQAVIRNMDLTDGNIWIRADLYSGDMADVTAIAVDASKKADGSDFVLEPLDSAVVIINMQAPSGEEATQLIAQGANAYNNAYLLGTSVDVESGHEDSENFVRKDYTKVGLEEYKIGVRKIWDDDGNRDGIRPASVTVRLLADGADTGLTVSLTGASGEIKYFTNIPYCRPDGTKIIYSIEEVVPPGYRPSIAVDGMNYTLTNIHEPEKTSLSGVKTWEGDTAQLRPQSVQVELLANGRVVRTITITPDYEGNWQYEFTDLFKNENGREIVYSVREKVTTGPQASYRPEVTGMDIKNIYHPFGDLSISKAIINATPVSIDQKFTFILVLTTENGDPIEGEYDYTIKDASGAVKESGKMGASAEIILGDGDVFLITELPEYINYQVSELEVPGFKAAQIRNAQGVIRPNTTAEVSYTNRYFAEGGTNLEVGKKLLNRSLTRYQFVFELYDENDQLIKTASNGYPEEIIRREDGTIDYSAATATFGRLSFTQEDHEKTFTYTVKERIANKDGYVYDESVYTVKITPRDNGDGTMDVTDIRYFAADGSEIPAPASGSPMTFENEYKAEGELILRAFKDLQGRPLQDGEFSFQLMDSEGNLIETVTNAADGGVTFSALHFTEKDIEKTFYYAVREVSGSDATVKYDERVLGYQIVVRDNGDGTLSFTQGPATPTVAPKPRDPDAVLYAVSIYGIGQDVDENGETMGITFGPATGGDYVSSEKPAHIALSAETESEKCIHNHTLAEIINQNYADPHVFDNCITNRCTATVDLMLSPVIMDAAGAAKHKRITGDGPSILYYELKKDATIWNGDSSSADGAYTTGGWKASNLRAVLNGIQDETYANSWAKLNQLDEQDSLFAAFPAALREAIGYKKVTFIPGHYSSSTVPPTETCADKLWLFSRAELGSSSAYSAVEGSVYSRNEGAPVNLSGGRTAIVQSYNGAVEGKQESWWTRSLGPMLGRVYYVYENGSNTTTENSNAYNSNKNYGVSPGFSLKAKGAQAQEEIIITGWTSEEAELPVFVNTLEPGSLEITKSVQNSPSADPEQEFKFRLRLIGDELEGKSFNFDFTRLITHPAMVDLRVVHHILNRATEIEETLQLPYGKPAILRLKDIEDNSEVQERDVSTLVSLGYKGEWRDFGTKVHHVSFSRPDPNDPGQDILSDYNSYTYISGENMTQDQELHLYYNSQLIGGGGGGYYPPPMWLAFERTADLQKQMMEDGEWPTDLHVMLSYSDEDGYMTPAGDVGFRLYKISDLREGLRYEPDRGFRDLFTQEQLDLMRSTSADEINFKELFANGPREGDIAALLARGDIAPEMNGNTDDQGHFSTGSDPNPLQPGLYLIQFDPIRTPNGSISFPPYWAPVVSGSVTLDLNMGAIDTRPYDDSLFTSLAYDIPTGDGEVQQLDREATQLPDGSYEFILKANETLTIPDLPAGTAYQVWEETPDGWVLVQQVGVSGVIEPLTTARAGFTNEYQPGTASAQFTGLKTLDNSAASADSFLFELWKADSSYVKQELLESQPVQAGGFIQFGAVTYNEAGTYYYVIREVDPEREDVDYDVHEEHVQVRVTDNGNGTMSAVTTVLEDGTEGIRFANKTRPGSLEIEKKGGPVTENNKDNLFTFKVTLKNEKGLPLSDEEVIYWYVKDAEGNILQPASPAGIEEVQEPAQPQDSAQPQRVRRLLKAPLRNGQTPLRAANYNDPIAVYDSADKSLRFYNAETAATFTPSATQTVYEWESWSTGITTTEDVPWNNVRGSIVTVEVADEGIAPETMAFWFNHFEQATSFELGKLDTSRVTSMKFLFSWCTKITSLDLTTFDTSAVTDMHEMFEKCGSLESVNLSSFNTENVTALNRMFAECVGLQHLDLSSFDTDREGVICTAIFIGCDSLRLIKLGEKTKFYSDYTYLPEPIVNDFARSAKWIQVEDSTLGPYTPAEMFSRNASAPAGTWVWELGPVAVFDYSDGSLEFYNTQISREYLALYKKEKNGSQDAYWFRISDTQIGYIAWDGYGSNRSGRHPWSQSSSNGGFDVKNLIKTVKVVDDGIAPFGAEQLFTYLPNVESMDLSKLDLRTVVNSGKMFGHGKPARCNAYKIVLGENFRFTEESDRFADILSDSYPERRNYYTGKWIREDEAAGPYSEDELVAAFNANPAAMAGAWIWEVKSEASVLQLDPQGGVLSGNNRIEQQGASPITLPEPERFHYLFAGWNTQADGSGTSYQAGASFTPELGKTTTLYAQWTYDTRPYVTVRHYQQKQDLSGYVLTETEQLPVTGNPFIPPVKDYTAQGFRAAAAQTITDPQDGQVVSYYYDRTVGTVRFDGNGADSGQMREQQLPGGANIPLNANAYSRTGYIFTGWNTAADGSGESFVNSQAVSMAQLGLADGGAAALYAQWLGNDQAESPVQGVIYVKCRIGETVVIPDLPDGTTYTVEEVDNPAGWQTGSITAGDPVSAAKVSYVTANNEYHANGLIYLEAHKLYPNQELEAGAFSFELLDALGNVVATASNETVDDRRTIFDDDGNEISNPWYGTGLVTFGPLEYDESHIGRVFVYSIKEVKGEDSLITYDNHEEKVYVYVRDAGNGTLNVTAEYDEDGPLFVNSRETLGELSLSKSIENATEEAAETLFRFRVDLKDANGEPLEGAFPVKILQEDYEVKPTGLAATRYSHMDNVDDAGNKLSDYNNSEAFNQVVTIEGALRLYVTITWGGESASYDWACLWEGAHPEYTAYNNHSSSLSGKLGGGRYTDEANTKQFVVEGDTVTFAFRSDSSMTGDGYGYYAVIESRIEMEETGVRTAVVSHEGYIELKGGEKAVVTNLPEGASYEITEIEAPGWTLTEKSGDTGIIEIGNPKEALFSNRYDASGELVLTAKKRLVGEVLKDDEFYFELQDEAGNVLAAAPAKADGSITFPLISYTMEDNGKTFKYYIREIPGTREKMIYDTHVEEVVVTLRDGGEGVLIPELTFLRPEGAVFVNRLEYELPSVGGHGPYLSTIFGTMFLALAAAWAWENRKSRAFK